MVHAPAIQVMLTVQFAEPVPSYNALTMAALYELFSEEFPNFKQVPLALEMPYAAAQVLGLMEVRPVQTDTPRVQFETSDGRWSILFQYDRMSLVWHKSDPADSNTCYEGFENFFRKFGKWYDVALQYFKERNIILVPDVIELSYSNAFRMRDEDGSDRRISSVYSFLGGGPRIVFNYSYEWNEPINTSNGVLSASITGVSFFGDNVPHSLASFSGIMKVEPAGASGLEATVRSVREAIRRMAGQVVSPERMTTY